MAECNVNDLIEAAKCFSCLDERQVKLAELALLCGIIRVNDPMAACSVQDLMNDAKCFACLDTKQMGAIALQLLCEILQGGGAGGTSCNLCGTADPVDAPTCDCSLYTRTDTGEMWYWEPIGATWVKILSND